MEVEIKVKCDESEFDRIRQKITELGGTKANEKRQKDQYYNLPQKDLRGTREYIRVRDEGDETVLAFHRNISDGLTHEYETSVGNKKMLDIILENFGLTKLGLIDKYREKFLLNEFEICLDKVKDIGTIVEIETDGNEQNWEEKQKSCIELLTKLGLSKNKQSKEYLCDIATRK